MGNHQKLVFWGTYNALIADLWIFLELRAGEWINGICPWSCVWYIDDHASIVCIGPALMASEGARVYVEGLGAVPQQGPGAESWWGSKWRSPKLKTFASEDKLSQKLAPIFRGSHDKVIYHNTHVNQQCVRSIEACIEAMLVSFF